MKQQQFMILLLVFLIVELPFVFRSVPLKEDGKDSLEDRRPNSAADPYKVAARIIKTVK